MLAIAGGPAAVAPGSHERWPSITAADRAALERVLDETFEVEVHAARASPTRTDPALTQGMSHDAAG